MPLNESEIGLRRLVHMDINVPVRILDEIGVKGSIVLDDDAVQRVGRADKSLSAWIIGVENLVLSIF